MALTKLHFYFRPLNAITIEDRYPLPRIDDQIDGLANAKYFTALDMTSGYYQIPISNESVEKTVFVTSDGHYEFLRMPFGLCNAPAVFQRAVHKALGPLKDTIAFVYLDDILIPSVDKEEGLTRLRQVFQVLELSRFSINLKKCQFFKTSIAYLGRVISNDRVQSSPKKTEALSNSLPPQNVKQVRQFLGLAGYFRKFVAGFATNSAPISNLLKKNVPFLWTESCEQARLKIIQLLITEPVLVIYDANRSTELHTDASAIGIVAVNAGT